MKLVQLYVLFFQQKQLLVKLEIFGDTMQRTYHGINMYVRTYIHTCTYIHTYCISLNRHHPRIVVALE